MRLEKLPKVKPLLFAFIHKQEHLFFIVRNNFKKGEERYEK